jgi:branched-chain amino acid transport system substrate-binding protein
MVMAAAATGLTALLLCAGCAGSGSQSDGAAGSSSPALKLSPIRLMAIDDGVPGLAASHAAGRNAAIAEINASGGIKGHPIEVVACATNGDPNQATTCARQAVDDKSVLAFDDLSTSYTPEVLPLAEQAGMASIGGIPSSSGDFSSFGESFPTNSGVMGPLGGLTVLAQTLHAKKISMIYLNLPSLATLPTLANDAILHPLGLRLWNTVAISPTATNVTPQIAQAASGADAILIVTTQNLTIQLVRAAEQLGLNVPLMVLGMTDDASQMSSQIGGATDNVYGVGYYNRSSKGWSDFEAAMKKYQPNVTDQSDSVPTGYLAVKLFAYVADHASSLTRQGISDELRTLNNYSTDGMTPPLNFTARQTAGGGQFTAVPNMTISYLGKLGNGRWQAQPNSPSFTSVFPAP